MCVDNYVSIPGGPVRHAGYNADEKSDPTTEEVTMNFPIFFF